MYCKLLVGLQVSLLVRSGAPNPIRGPFLGPCIGNWRGNRHQIPLSSVECLFPFSPATPKVCSVPWVCGELLEELQYNFREDDMHLLVPGKRRFDLREGYPLLYFSSHVSTRYVTEDSILQAAINKISFQVTPHFGRYTGEPERHANHNYVINLEVLATAIRDLSKLLVARILTYSRTLNDLSAILGNQVVLHADPTIDSSNCTALWMSRLTEYLSFVANLRFDPVPLTVSELRTQLVDLHNEANVHLIKIRQSYCEDGRITSELHDHVADVVNKVKSIFFQPDSLRPLPVTLSQALEQYRSDNTSSIVFICDDSFIGCVIKERDLPKFIFPVITHYLSDKEIYDVALPALYLVKPDSAIAPISDVAESSEY